MGMSTHAAAAKMIRAEMKKHGIAGRVRARIASMMTAVDIYVEDLPPATARELRAFCAQFEYGHFDGMTDCYEHSNRRDDLPQVKYVSVENRMSDTLRTEIEAWADDYFGEGHDTDTWCIFQQDSRLASRFWATRKPRVRAAA